MRCSDPCCTGIHDNGRNGHIYAEQCPAVKERHRAINRRRQRIYEGTAAGMLAAVRANANKRGNR